MPTPPGFPGQSSLLSGLFGVLQSAALQHAPTAAVWSALRLNAGTWAWQAQGSPGAPTAQQLEAQGAQILSQQGVGIQNVNTYRALAGQWRQAARTAQQLGPNQQIMPRNIFQPPWAETGGAGAPIEFRVRVEWNVTPATGASFTKWSSYQISAPLTTVTDLLTQAVGLAKGAKSSALVTDPSLANVASFEIEQA